MKTDERIASRLEVREGVKNNDFAYTSVCLLESDNSQSICGLCLRTNVWEVSRLSLTEFLSTCQLSQRWV